MRKALENIKLFKDRRAKLAPKMTGSVLILSSLEETIRNGNVHNAFRQDSNLYYLTGFEEPETIFVFRPGQTPETVLFVRTKNKERETWDGFRFGPQAAQSEFGMDEVYPVEEFDKQIVGLLKGADKLYYRFYRNRHLDAKMEDALQGAKLAQGRTGFGFLPIYDSEELLGEQRIIKSDAEIENHRKACEISAEAHAELMKYIRPGMSEREAHGFFIYQAMKRGAQREGYNGIVASGSSSTTLHYTFNDQIMKSGDLLLVDCGAEYNYFTGDITRTYPVNGQFTDEQAEVYEAVLKVQKHIIGIVRPGITFQEMNETADLMLTDVMLQMGFMSGRKEDIMKAREHKKYYPHSLGHFLGMDVHDSGIYFQKDGKPREIAENSVFTVEPGLYFPIDDESIPKKYRGIGIRIEDDVRVTLNGCEVMTSKAPKEISELQKLIAK